ncbi:MAG: HU family DNA-binding protein [Thermoanaerobaculia bacterium]
MPQIGQRDALDVLTKLRLLELAAALGLGVPGRRPKSEIVDAIASSPRAPFPRILERLSRDELKAICRAAGIDDSGREKAVIADRILGRRPDGSMETLTRADLIEDVANASGVLRQDAEEVVTIVFASMVESLQAGETIELRGFGCFRLRDRAARMGRNPKTRARVRVPAKRVCYFKPGRGLLELLNS